MIKFEIKLELDGVETAVIIQEIDKDEKNDIRFFMIHRECEVIAVVSADGNCSFEVLQGHYSVEQLFPICSIIKEHYLHTSN